MIRTRLRPWDLSRLPQEVVARPLVVMAAAYAAGDGAGIITGRYSTAHAWAAPVILIAIVIAAIAAASPWLTVWGWTAPLHPQSSIGSDRHSPRVRTLAAGFAAILGFFLLGAWRGYGILLPSPRDAAQFGYGGLVELRGTVVGEPDLVAAADGRLIWGFVVRAESVVSGGEMHPSDGRVWVRLASDDNAAGDLKGKDDYPVRKGDVVEVRGRLERPGGSRNPGGGNQSLVLAGRGCNSELYARSKAALVSRKPGSIDPLSQFAFELRRSFQKSMRAVLSAPHADLVDGFVLGSRSRLPQRVEDDFARTGTIHILSTSGSHVMVVTAVFLFVWRGLRIPRSWADVSTVFCLVVFALAAGAGPPIVRSVLMASLYLFAYPLGREPDTATALAAAALVLLGTAPELILNVGFQLSFVTVAALLALLGPLRLVARSYGMGSAEASRERDRNPHWRCLGRIGPSVHRVVLRCWNYVLMLLGVSMAAQVGSVPLVAEYFNLFSIIAVFANMIIVPAVGIALTLALSLWPLAIVSPNAASAIAHVSLSPLLDFVVWTAQALAEVPFASIGVPSPGWPLIYVYYGLLLVGARAFAIREFTKRRAATHISSAVDEREVPIGAR